MHVTSTRPSKVLLILLLLVLVSSLHFFTGTLDPDLHAWHLFFRKLYFIPIIAAAAWFSLRGACLTGLAAIAVYAIHVKLNWPQDPMEQMDQLGEMASFAVLAVVSGKLVSMERKVREQAQREKIRTVVAALTEALAARDPETGEHCRRVAEQAEKFAIYLGLPAEDCRDLYLAGLLHDVGKIGIRDDILLKPGSLNDDERQKIMAHPRIAEHILTPVGFHKVVDYVATHHENVDGSGYPDGLSGEDIPYCGRILAIVDTYDALLSNRSYHHALENVAELRQIMESMAGKKIDKILLEQFWLWLKLTG